MEWRDGKGGSDRKKWGSGKGMGGGGGRSKGRAIGKLRGRFALSSSWCNAVRLVLIISFRSGRSVPLSKTFFHSSPWGICW